MNHLLGWKCGTHSYVSTDRVTELSGLTRAVRSLGLLHSSIGVYHWSSLGSSREPIFVSATTPTTDAPGNRGPHRDRQPSTKRSPCLFTSSRHTWTLV